MPQRSWLAKAKSIHDLGGHFYVPNAGRPWNDERDALAEAKWMQTLKRPLPAAVEAPEFYGSAMHDSTVVGIERKGSLLRLRLDAIDARNFSSELAKVLDAPQAEGPWPVDLLLHDVTYVRAAREELRGDLRFFDWERLGQKEGERDSSFLYDWFFPEQGRLQWIAQLWPHVEHREARPNDVFLMVDCARATADDRCGDAFARVYGHPAAVLYADARALMDEKPIDFNVFDSAETGDYIRRRMAVHGFTRESFR